MKMSTWILSGILVSFDVPALLPKVVAALEEIKAEGLVGKSGAKGCKAERASKMEEQVNQRPKTKSGRGAALSLHRPKGLLGILESKKIWASHLRYLNDTSEGQIFSKLL